MVDSRNRRIPGLSTRNGRYYAQLWVERADGRKAPRRFPLTLDGRPVTGITEAKEATERLRHQRREDKLPTEGHKPTVAKYAETYLASGVFEKKKPGTRENESQALARWVRHCGNVRVDKLTTKQIAAFIDLRLKGEILLTGRRKTGPTSLRTVKLDVIALRNLLNAAKDDGHLRELPHHPKIEPPEPLKKKTVDPADMDRLIATAPAACSLNGEQLVDYLRLLCYCGAREQEALKLRWDDVDEKTGTLTIGSDGDTKNRESRKVEFNPALASHLASMKVRRQPDSEWLFPSPRRGKDDRPAKSFRESLRLARAAAKLPTFGFHDCRRYFATMCIQSGIDIQTVALWLGHHDGGVLVAKTYADVLKDHRRKMAARLNLNGEEVQ